jgi:hemoglobin-like flavoprotein
MKENPMITPAQKSLVQNSFAQIAPIAKPAAALFYSRLFELDPTLKPLFKTDMTQQGEKLITMIATAVHGLDNPEQLVPTLKALGHRHAGYGVPQTSYATVGDALLWTLRQGLGPDFTAEVENAWAAAYDLLSRTMQDGSRATAS